MNILKRKPEVTIEQIHAEFESAEDRLLDKATSLLATLQIPTESGIRDKADRLKALGFTEVEDVAYAERFTAERQKALEIQAMTTADAELIQYYKRTYPFQKFLTIEELDRICTKYNLNYAPVKNYIKTVPDKNLLDIENAKPLDLKDTVTANCIITMKAKDILEHVDENLKNKLIKGLPCYTRKGYTGRDLDYYYTNSNKHYAHALTRVGVNSYNTSFEVEFIYQEGLFIAAPKSHFDLKGLKKDKLGFFKSKTIVYKEVKDPIVFRYVQGGVQILTMWGDEHFDPNKEPQLVPEVLN